MTRAPGQPGAFGLRRSALRTIFWFLAASLLFNAFFGDMGIVQALRQRRAAAHVRRQVRDLLSANQTLRADIEELRRNPYRIEAIAREDLGLSRPGEIIFIFQDATEGEEGSRTSVHP
jgi:cell division protein FtsB